MHHKNQAFVLRVDSSVALMRHDLSDLGLIRLRKKNAKLQIKTEILSFCLNQGPSTPANLMMRVKTILEPCLFQARLSVHFRIKG